MNYYKVYGRTPISVVVEMGLGACIGEWEPFAESIANIYGVLLYERRGINQSKSGDKKRTPENIADELYELLKSLNCEDKIILLAHSQGGLYATAFSMKYPEMVRGIILLDPLSPYDNEFAQTLTAREYKQSGVDKSGNFRMMEKMARMRLGGITKKLLEAAPPFYYYKYYTKEQKDNILNCVKNPIHAKTALEEYVEAHQEENLTMFFVDKTLLDMPMYLVTHSSELAIRESMHFGRNEREFATKVELMWQDIMKRYLGYFSKSGWICAEQSTHYIHLSQPDVVLKALYEVENETRE